MGAKVDKKNGASNGVRERKKKRSQFVEVGRRLKKNKAAMFGLFIIILLILTAVFADFIAPYDYAKQDLRQTLLTPSKAHLFGTDEFGRDIFTRVVYGARISLMVGILAVGIAMIIGGALGAIAGFYGGKLDNLIMRTMDVLLAIPSILLAISIVAALGSGLVNLMIAVGISNIPRYARIVRASILSVRDQEYVEASKSVGANDFTIITKHIIPNCLAPVIVQGTLGVASAILSCAGLSFIGLGINPPTPEWGSMLSRGRDYLRDYWHITAFPGMAIMVTIFALNLLGDGLRDAFDPKLKN